MPIYANIKLGQGDPSASYPLELVGRDPYQMYGDLCETTNQHHDPCVIDVFISAVRYMEGGAAKKWWNFTVERKKHLSDQQLP